MCGRKKERKCEKSNVMSNYEQVCMCICIYEYTLRNMYLFVLVRLFVLSALELRMPNLLGMYEILSIK